MKSKNIGISFFSEHLGTLMVLAISALAAGAGKTWLDTRINTGDIKAMKVDHDLSIEDRYTATDAGNRESDVNGQLRELRDRIAHMEGRHAGHD